MGLGLKSVPSCPFPLNSINIPTKGPKPKPNPSLIDRLGKKQDKKQSMTANLTFELPIDLGNWDLDFIKTVNYGINSC